MALTVLNVRLSDNAMAMVDQLRKVSNLSREQWAFKQIRDAAASWTMRWNLIHAHGQAALDPQGQVTVPLSAVPAEMPIGTGSPNANLHISFTDTVIDRVVRMAKLNAAFRITVSRMNPWPTVTAWAEGFLTDAAAIHFSALEDQQEKAEVEAAERTRRLEEERRRRLESLQGGEPESSPSTGPVAVLEVEPDSAPPVDEGSTGSPDGGSSP